MALKNFGFRVDINGISPKMIADAGTQGDHCATKIKFILSDGLCDNIETIKAQGNVVVRRFDVYDGEGGIWQSDTTEISGTVEELILEERHTRFGGKITVYLVITALSQDNETQMELYSFPAVIQLKNRPEGVRQDGENYESISSLAEAIKQKAAEALASATAAENTKKVLEEIAIAVEEKLKNGEFDGVGVESAEIVNDELIIIYTNGAMQNLGNVKGNIGPKGDKGEKGDKGDAPDLTNYYTKSECDDTHKGFDTRITAANDSVLVLQKSLENYYVKYEVDDKVQNASDIGIAAQNKLENEYYTKTEVDNLDCVKYISYEDDKLRLTDDLNSCIEIGEKIYMSSVDGIDVDQVRVYNLGTPIDDTDAVHKKYVDSLVGNIDSAIDELHNYAQAIIGGAE